MKNKPKRKFKPTPICLTISGIMEKHFVALATEILSLGQEKLKSLTREENDWISDQMNKLDKDPDSPVFKLQQILSK